MSKPLLLRTTLAAVLAGSTAILPAVAHDPTGDPAGQAGPERGQELFQPGLTYAAIADAETGEQRPPLYEGLGTLSMPVTTTSTAAQAYFDQGLRLTWAFNHTEARRSFRQAQRFDPDCAMCFWGEAFVLGPNINDGMHEEAVQPAYDAITRALALSAGTTPKEQALIAALATRYAIDPDADRASLDQAWADAMRTVATTYADDANVQVLLADALMNLQPWDYWEADGLTSKGNGAEIVATLETALAIDPAHPAAAHLYIHAVEASADPGRAEAVADSLRGSMPAAGHLVHMPAHIYTRVGRHADSMAVNHDAIIADEAFLTQVSASASPLYRYGYYPHNVHFLMISAQMAGVAADVIGTAEKLADVTSDEVSQQLAWVQAIKSAPYSAHAQFSDPETILALPDPGDRFPFVQGFWHYARGVAYAFTGALEPARGEIAAIERLIAEADLSGLEAQYLPARDVLGIARLVVGARVDQAAGNFEAAERQLREAIALQEGVGYMEPPYWYYPVRQTLGATLLQQGRADEAIEAFEAALAESPRNGWVLWGLLQAQIATGGKTDPATEAAFQDTWLGDTALLRIDRL